MNIIDKNNPKPLYLQLEELIRENIESNKWKENTAIPSEYEMSKLYNISRITIRSACNQLVKEGLLYRVAGKGTFVSKPKITTKSLAYKGFREQLESMGYEITTKIISKNIIVPTKLISEKLGLKENENVIELKRLRLIKNEPISLHYSYLSYDKFKKIYDDEKLESEQLCVLLENSYNIKPYKVLETLESITATKDVALIFKTQIGYPLLVLEDIMKDENNKTYEYSKVIFRGDKIKLQYEFTN